MEWWQVSVNFLISGFGVSVPLFIWWLSRRGQDTQRRRHLFELLMIEMSTNHEIIERGMSSVQLVLSKQRGASKEPSEGDFISEEQEVEIAPLFMSSFQFLVENDLIRYFPADVIPDLYKHYAEVSRANWLISRVQQFKFRTPILDGIYKALKATKETQEKVRGRLDVEKTKRMKE